MTALRSFVMALLCLLAMPLLAQPPTVQHASRVQIKPGTPTVPAIDALRIWGGLQAGLTGNVQVIDINGALVAAGTIGGGTVGSPGVAPASDPDTGWFWPAPNEMAASLGGVERVRFDTIGRIGLNTPTPSQRLHIVEPSSQVGIRLERTDAEAWDINVNTNLTLTHVGGATSLTLTPTRIGVFNSSPAYTLDVTGAVNTTGNLRIGSFVESSLIPDANDLYSIGSTTKFWKEAFITQINSIIFAENTVQITGGWQIVGKNAGSLAVDANISAIQLDLGKNIGTVPQWILIKSHDATGTIKTEYIEVTSLASGTLYNVTRDVTSLHATDPAWNEGTPWLLLGVQGDGRIQLYASSGLPQISVLRQGATANAQTDLVRLGGLDGMPTMGAAPGRYGIFIGETSTAYLKYQKQSSGSATGDDEKLIVQGTIQATAGWFGDSTNDVVIDATGLSVGNTGNIRGGATSYSSGTGFWLGFDSGEYRLRVGNPAGALLSWASNALTLVGATLTAPAITGGTITGGTIRTSASNPRIELTSSSLRGYDSGGTVQFEALTSNGKLTGGAGNAVLDATGLGIAMNTANAWSDSNALRFTDSVNTGERIGMGLYYDSAFPAGTYRTMEIVNGDGSAIEEIILRAGDASAPLGASVSSYIQIVQGVSLHDQIKLRTVGPLNIAASNLDASATAVDFDSDLQISLNNSTSSPGYPWLRSDGQYLVINPDVGGDLYLAWDTGNVIRAGVTILGGVTSASVDLGSAAHKWRHIYWSEPTTTGVLFPVVSDSGQLKAKTNGFNGACSGTPTVVQFGIIISC